MTRVVKSQIMLAVLAGFVLVAEGARAGNPGLEAAEQLQSAFTDVAEKASPAVVVITNKQLPRSAVRSMPRGLPPEFHHFFGIPEEPEQPGGNPRLRQVPQPAGKGSGVIVRPDGYVVTNYHVIKDAESLEVKLHDGRTFDSGRNKDDVAVVGYDEDTDLAVLKLGGLKEGESLHYLEFADSDKVKVGHWAIAVGAPFNFDYSVTVGVVSQKGRYDVRMNTYENYIQTDASINPGNSGGPLLNLRGEVIGINDFIITGGGMSRGNVGIGFAIASNLARQIVDALVEDGQVVRPWMGIVMQQMDAELKEQFGVEHGVLISDVVKGDPADKAGLKGGDVILEIGGRKMDSTHDVQFAVMGYQPGAAIPVLVDRRGARQTFEVVLKQRQGNSGVAASPAQGKDLLDKLGLAIEERENQVVVSGVMGGGEADAAGLLRGDIIREVNRREVATVAEVVQALSETSGGVALICRERNGMKQFVTLRVDKSE